MTTITIDKELALRVLEALKDVETQFMQRGILTDAEHPDRVSIRNANYAISDLRAAIEAQQEETDWKSVPMNASAEMLHAGADYLYAHTTEFTASAHEQAEQVYKAMLEAAPQPAQPQEPSRHMTERWNIEFDGDDLLICFNLHDKGDKCEYERYIKAASQLAQPQEPIGWLESPHGAFRANPLHKVTLPSQVLNWNIPVYATTQLTKEQK